MSQSLCGISLFCALGLIAASRSTGEDLSLEPRPGVLLLRNGTLMAGEILLSGDRYDVDVDGGQIHIKRSEVEFVGRTVLECYERRRAQIEPGNVQESLELAEWCLRNELFEQAALALADAVDADPQHPRIALLERRLKFALQQPADPVAKASAGGDAPSIHDLERTVSGLPPHSVETFTISIQSVLMNHCSTAGCHGSQSATPLKLLRAGAGRKPSARATQRNLYSVLALVDRERPAESPLLTVPTRPHGTVKSAIFTTRETNQYRQLVAWVYQVAGQPVPAGVVGVSAAEPAAHRAARRVHPRRKPTRAADGVSDDAPDAKQSAAHHLPGQAPQAADDESADVEAVDPFDPEVFNRRYQQPDDRE